MFTIDQWMSLVRHILTWGGGILVAKGIMSEGVVNELIGVGLTLGGLLWAFVTHTEPPKPDPAIVAVEAINSKPAQAAPSVSTVAVTPPPTPPAS